ncbi:hypothetical protein SAMN04488109_6841 [Chryseolinea serpens]|uniref:Immunity MXAN-0049 protein domain-containing protein n=1 Tax=Chryseolinea serpens TaxID=947013 RepID=A0A1M5XT82_9BACT|nr:DUF1629 domain-containing protein [Chryseolinea serpens]SHI02922.1 hypothetical protein SAMN04488109_6841 [Chryseolinea serpens]
MNYYIIKPAVDTKETGSAYPAVESYDGYDFNASNSVHKLRSREFPDFKPDLRFKLAKDAKLCDLMGQATINAHGFLISERLKGVFEKANIVPHTFYHATIEVKGVLHNYYWMHLAVSKEFNFMNYKESDFYIKRFSKNLGKIEIESEDVFLDKRNEIGVTNTIGFNSIHINHTTVDLFAFPFFTEIYISEKLKSEIEKNTLTGIHISLAEKIISS